MISFLLVALILMIVYLFSLSLGLSRIFGYTNRKKKYFFVLSRTKVLLKILQSLLGLLAFAFRIMPFGWVFPKRLYRAISSCSPPSHLVRITSEIIADLRVWLQFIRTFNGCSMWQYHYCSASALHLHSDAAESCGYGAYWNGHWSAAAWHDTWKSRGLTSNFLIIGTVFSFSSPGSLGFSFG